MPGFQSTRLVTEGALEPFFFLYTDDSIQGNPETCKQSSIMLNYEVKNTLIALCLTFPATAYAQPADGNAADESATDGSAADGSATDENTADEVVIYHTNDTHGYLSGDGSSVIGIDQVAGLKESTPGSVLVDAGDATQGLPLASLTKGSDVIELMNLAGYDLMTAGTMSLILGQSSSSSMWLRQDFQSLRLIFTGTDSRFLRERRAEITVATP